MNRMIVANIIVLALGIWFWGYVISEGIDGTKERIAELEYGINNKVSGVIYCSRHKDRPSKYFSGHIDRFDPKLGVVTVTGYIEGFDCEFIKSGEYSKFGYNWG